MLPTVGRWARRNAWRSNEAAGPDAVTALTRQEDGVILPARPLPLQAGLMRRLAMATRVRRHRCVRAFEDKQGGWTLVASNGEALRVVGRTAVFIWESLQGEGCVTGELLARVLERYPDTRPEVVERDFMGFIVKLEGMDFAETAGLQWSALRARNPRAPG
jgi:hypothetical protein